MEGSVPAQEAEPGTLKATLATTPGKLEKWQGYLELSYTKSKTAWVVLELSYTKSQMAEEVSGLSYTIDSTWILSIF